MHALHLAQRPSHIRPQIYTCLMNESVLPHLLKHLKEMILIWHWNVRLFSTFFSPQWSNAEIHHLHSCSHCWDKISQRATGKESLFWLPFCRHSPSRQRRHDRRSLRQLVTSCPQAGSRERWMRMISSFSSLFSTGSKLTRQCSWI